MPAKRAPIGGKGDDGGAPGGYVQVFLYRVPKANHDSFAATEEKLFAIFRRHGIVGSDLYVCGEARIFKGFRDLRAALEAAPEEEVLWRSTGTATRPTAFGLSKASARTRRPARCSVGSSSSRPPASS